MKIFLFNICWTWFFFSFVYYKYKMNIFNREKIACSCFFFSPEISFFFVFFLICFLFFYIHLLKIKLFDKTMNSWTRYETPLWWYILKNIVTLLENICEEEQVWNHININITFLWTTIWLSMRNFIIKTTRFIYEINNKILFYRSTNI